MSSTVSLIPSIKATAIPKKRRPTFRPGGGAAAKKKRVPTLEMKIQIEEKETPIQNAPKEPFEDHEDLQNHALDRDCKENIPQKPVVTSNPRRPQPRNKITVAAARKENEPQNNEGKSLAQKKEESAPAQASLAIYCTKYRAQKRQKDNHLPVPPPPPPPEDDEEVTPAGPQVKIVDGEIVLQESSMMLPNARKTVQEVEEEYQHVVEEEGQTTIVGASYNSFVARRKPQHWAVEETKLFYNSLRQVGADFVTMESFFRNRTRKQLKKKFQIEQVKNARLIELALDPRNKLPVDLSIFNVDKDSIVVTKQPIVPRNSGRRPPNPDTDSTADFPTPVAAEVSRDIEIKVDPISEPTTHDVFDAFDQSQNGDVAAFVLEQEMGADKPPTAVIPLAPTVFNKTKSKKPKFRAGMRKGK